MPKLENETLSDIAGSFFAGGVKVGVVLTLDQFNQILAAVVGILTVVHLIIKLRQSSRK